MTQAETAGFSLLVKRVQIGRALITASINRLIFEDSLQINYPSIY